MTNSANTSPHTSPKVPCPSLSPFAHSHVHPSAEPVNSRSTARQKLTRLTRQQFQELSTDVYDDLIRRKTNSDSNQGPSSVSLLSLPTSNSPAAVVPFLPVREEFHPKRNQARQKLAILLVSRFKDLSSDVYYELVRRYPEFKEEVRLIFPPSTTLFLPLPSPPLQQPPPDATMISSDSAYDDFPSPDFPTPRDRSARGGRVSAAPNEDGEKMRRDYEFRIATMQSRIAYLERDIEDGDLRPRLSLQLCSTFLGSDLFAGDHRFLRWLSPSDPSTNHNITRNTHHNGTAQWFFQDSIYNEWKSSGSFLWVRGKRALLLVFSMK
jgi:hypothetical protein